MNDTQRRASNQECWDRPVTRPVVVPDGNPVRRSLNFRRCEVALRAVLEQGVGD